MTIFLALRNIARNKKNSAIIALLIAVITFLFFTGNSIISRAGRSIRGTYIESLTGDVVLEASGDITMNLFGANTPIIEAFFTIPVLPAHDVLVEIAVAESGTAGISSQVSGRAFLDILGIREPALLCGIDAETYFSLFPGIVLAEGRFLRPGEYGAMITQDKAQRIETQSGLSLPIGTPLLLTSGGAAGFKIREVPLVGIFTYANPGAVMNEIIITDPQTVRVLNSIQVAGNADADDSAMGLLAEDIDDLFGTVFFATEEVGEDEFTIDFLEAFLSENEGSSENETGGDWNFILLRLEKGVSPAAFISSINKKINNFGATAVNWRIAAGTSAILLLLVQALFNAGIFLVSVAGIIAAINILLISVFRRTREIGTLRAIGASDAYIRSLIFSENLVLAMIAGFTGVLCGALLVRLVNIAEFRIPNELISSLLGGPVLKLEFMPLIAALSFAVAIVLAFAASVYPVEAAVRIEPIAAVRQG